MNEQSLTDAQIALAIRFIDRAQVDRDYRMLAKSVRYQRMLDLVRANIEDPLIAGDIGVTDMVAITAYFMSRRDMCAAKGE